MSDAFGSRARAGGAFRAVSPRLAVAGLSLLVAALLLAPTLTALARHMPIWLEDDAYYYAVIARRLAHGGASSFDGRTATNGYHPLWLLVLTVQNRLVGAAPIATLILEAILMTAGFAVLAAASRVRNLAGLTIFACVYAHYLGAMSMSGMEVSLLVFSAAVFVHTLDPPRAADRGSRGAALGGGVWLGLAGAMCIGARIDAAVFVVPAMALAPRPRVERLVAFGMVAFAGALYAGSNLALFGAAMPISSAVKSLGGLQINHLYLAQLAAEARHPLGHGRHLLTLALLAAAAVIAGSAASGTRARALGVACGVGGLMFFAKLALFSSWRVWPWYDFPLVFAFTAIWLRLAPWLDAIVLRGGVAARGSTLALTAVALSMLAALGVSELHAIARAGRTDAGGFAELNAQAERRFAPILADRAVAMGDRAGSFAAVYPGSVTQLEGLVNDVAWLRRLRRGGEVGDELCARGVRFMLAWQPDLGRYETLRVPVMRPALTQFRAPVVVVHRRDELATQSDAAVYDDVEDERPNRLYLWRLTCPV